MVGCFLRIIHAIVLMLIMGFFSVEGFVGEGEGVTYAGCCVVVGMRRESSALEDGDKCQEICLRIGHRASAALFTIRPTTSGKVDTLVFNWAKRSLTEYQDDYLNSSTSLAVSPPRPPLSGRLLGPFS